MTLNLALLVWFVDGRQRVGEYIIAVAEQAISMTEAHRGNKRRMVR
jgi:hypothetical protein